MKILVYGLGYVGLSLSTLLGQNNSVVAVDIDNKKVDLVNEGLSPIKDEFIERFLKEKKSVVRATLTFSDFSWPDFIIVATPTNYDPISNQFDTSSVESVLEEINLHKTNATIVIKSTVPVGFTSKMCPLFPNLKILFSPEFLREGRALEDNLFPSRIIVGASNDSLIKESEVFANLLNDCAIQKTKIIIMQSTEAEAVKLFANTYLATRVAFFNELDTFAEINNLDASKIIHGICMDSRIGDFYNNPSFGYGGYCLPKDTKQLLSEFKSVPNDIIAATVRANVTRANYISETIVKKAMVKSNNPVIGIYRLIMKADSDNFRSSSIQNIIQYLQEKGIEMIVFEPGLDTKSFNGIEVIRDFDVFKNRATIIIANRKDKLLNLLPSDKLYTRDIYGQN